MTAPLQAIARHVLRMEMDGERIDRSLVRQHQLRQLCRWTALSLALLYLLPRPQFDARQRVGADDGAPTSTRWAPGRCSTATNAPTRALNEKATTTAPST
jgi:hypothetical protein